MSDKEYIKGDSDSEVEGEDWLEHCVPWTGFERDLPVGIIGIPNTMNVFSFIKSVTIFDDDVEGGVRTGVKLKDLVPGMQVSDAELWTKRLEPFLTIIRVVEADGGAKKTLEEWYNTISADGVTPRHTNGLTMYALTKIRASLASGKKIKV